MATLTLEDNEAVILGTQKAARLQYYTKDANANMALLDLGPGGSVHVPVFAVGVRVLEYDLGLFGGFTQPGMFVLDADRDSYVGFHFSADDTPVVRLNGAGTVRSHTIPDVASDTFTLNAATQTLTNKTITGVLLTITDDQVLKLGTDGDQAMLNRSTILAANTALANVLIGTPVTPEIAANSLIISNITASGDVLMAANRGGNSEAFLFYDASARTLSLENTPLLNIGAAGTDFTSTGGLTLADILTVSTGGINVTGGIGNATAPAAGELTGWSALRGATLTISTSSGNLTLSPTDYIAAVVQADGDSILISGPNGGNARIGLRSNTGGGAFEDEWHLQITAGGNFQILNGRSFDTATSNTARLTLTPTGAATFTQGALAGGATALTLTPGDHTAITVERSQFALAASTQTLTDSTTIALVRYATFGALTVNGVAAGGTETVTTLINAEFALPVAGSNITVTNAPVALRALGNVIIGNMLPPAAGPTNTLMIASGTAPSTAPADSVLFYSSDISAGNTEPSFYCEGTAVLATGQADSASSVRVKMRINGTEVTLLAI